MEKKIIIWEVAIFIVGFVIYSINEEKTDKRYKPRGAVGRGVPVWVNVFWVSLLVLAYAGLGVMYLVYWDRHGCTLKEAVFMLIIGVISIVLIAVEGEYMRKVNGNGDMGKRLVRFWLGYHFTICVSLIMYMGGTELLSEGGMKLGLYSMIEEGKLKTWVRIISHCVGASVASWICNMEERGGLKRNGIELMKHLGFNLMLRITTGSVVLFLVKHISETEGGINWLWKLAGIIVVSVVLITGIERSRWVRKVWENLEKRYWVNIIYGNILMTLDWDILVGGVSNKEMGRVMFVVLIMVRVYRYIRLGSWERDGKIGRTRVTLYILFIIIQMVGMIGKEMGWGGYKRCEGDVVGEEGNGVVVEGGANNLHKYVAGECGGEEMVILGELELGIKIPSIKGIFLRVEGVSGDGGDSGEGGGDRGPNPEGDRGDGDEGKESDLEMPRRTALENMSGGFSGEAEIDWSTMRLICEEEVENELEVMEEEEKKSLGESLNSSKSSTRSTSSEISIKEDLMEEVEISVIRKVLKWLEEKVGWGVEDEIRVMERINESEPYQSSERYGKGPRPTPMRLFRDIGSDVEFTIVNEISIRVFKRVWEYFGWRNIEVGEEDKGEGTSGTSGTREEETKVKEAEEEKKAKEVEEEKEAKEAEEERGERSRKGKERIVDVERGEGTSTSREEERGEGTSTSREEERGGEGRRRRRSSDCEIMGDIIEKVSKYRRK